MPKALIKNSTKPVKILHLDAAEEPSQRKLFRFCIKRKKVCSKKKQAPGFSRNLQNLLREPGVWFVLYETFLRFERKVKVFVEKVFSLHPGEERIQVS